VLDSLFPNFKFVIMDKLKRLEVFVTAVDQGSFASAAEVLGLSAVMVGKHVQALEQELGVRLIQRTTRRQSVTAEGRILYGEAKRALEQVEQAYASIEASTARPGGLLRISAPMTLGSAMVAPLVAEFLRVFEDIRVELILSNQMVDLLDEGFDLAFRVSELADVDLVAKPLPLYRMLVCAAPDYLERCGTPQTPEQLAEHRILTHTSWNSRFSWSLIDDKGLPVRWPRQPVLASNDGQTLVQAAIAGVGILMQPDFLVAPALASGQLVPLLVDNLPDPKPVHMVYPFAKEQAPKLKAFLAFVLQQTGG